MDVMPPAPLRPGRQHPETRIPDRRRDLRFAPTRNLHPELREVL